MVVDQGLSIAQVVKDMKIGRTAVGRWVEQYCAKQQGQLGIGLLCPRTEIMEWTPTS